MLSNDQIRADSGITLLHCILQVAMLFSNQWSVLCPTAFFFFFGLLRMCRSLGERASGHDWFSCESQQSFHCSVGAVSVGFAVLRRTFAKFFRSWQRHCHSESLTLLQLFSAILNKAFYLNGGEQWFPPPGLCSGLQVRWFMWKATTAVNEPCFGSSEPLFLICILYREPGVSTWILNLTQKSEVLKLSLLDIHSHHSNFCQLCSMPDVYLRVQVIWNLLYRFTATAWLTVLLGDCFKCFRNSPADKKIVNDWSVYRQMNHTLCLSDTMIQLSAP